MVSETGKPEKPGKNARQICKPTDALWNADTFNLKLTLFMPNAISDKLRTLLLCLCGYPKSNLSNATYHTSIQHCISSRKLINNGDGIWFSICEVDMQVGAVLHRIRYDTGTMI
jgi:hypothetical protein